MIPHMSSTCAPQKHLTFYKVLSHVSSAVKVARAVLGWPTLNYHIYRTPSWQLLKRIAKAVILNLCISF